MDLHKVKNMVDIPNEILIKPEQKLGHCDQMLDASKEALYSNNVLIGNWREDRYAYKADKKAIVPCCRGISACLKHKTEYISSFIKPLTELHNVKELATEYITMRQDAFNNEYKFKESNVKIYDSDIYLNNMTSTTDYAYNIKPKNVTKCEMENVPKQKKQKIDVLSALGNLTNYGLREYKICQELKIVDIYGVSSYTLDYTNKFDKLLEY